MTAKQQMAEMFERARREGLWFHCAYQDLWWSPGELERDQADGSYVWGPQNFVLRDPNEQLRKLQRDAEGAAEMVRRFASRMTQ